MGVLPFASSFFGIVHQWFNIEEMPGLKLVDIHKSFGEIYAVNGVSFKVARGEIVALLGPSGCGKSTILSIIAGLEPVDRGELYWNGDSLRDVPTNKRDFGLMFQDFALFPHMNVADNVAFGLKMSQLPPGEIKIRVKEILALVGLPDYEGRNVNTLSGGEQQRVALARSLAPQPRLLMLDEPLGSLDRNLRERLVLDLGEILRQMSQTAIYVTHDQEEAFALADRVVVMNAGQVEQVGSPQGIYNQPASTFVANFLGLTNLIKGKAHMQNGQTYIETPLGQFPVNGEAHGQVTVLVRPDGMRVDNKGSYTLKGKILKRTFRGSTCRAIIEIKDIPLTFDFLSNTSLPGEGDEVRLAFDPQKTLQVLHKS
jgi:ABC-type Fe3+/spermidine/putrescine transport system ATPase subunit